MRVTGDAPWGYPAWKAGLEISRLAGAIDEELGEQRDRAAGGALFPAALPCRAGDVEVRPRIALGEAREEAGRRHRASRAPADVGEVGEVALQLLLVVFQ